MIKKSRSEDVFKTLYAKDTLKHSLLTPEEERALVVEKCRLQRIDNPTEETREQLKSIMQKLVASNMRLVASIASKSPAYRFNDVEWEDMMQEGAIGCMRGVQLFDDRRTDPSGKPLKLSTYITWWIRQTIERSRHNANSKRTIRLPVHFSSDDMPKVNRAVEDHWARHSERPTIEHLMEATGFGYQKVVDCLMWAGGCDSLDDIMPGDDGSDGGLTRGEHTADENAPCPSVMAENNDEHERLIWLIERSLTVREKRIIELRFGLIDGKQHTLQEIAEKFELTRERIRQIECAALKRLRHPKNARKVRGLAGSR